MAASTPSRLDRDSHALATGLRGFAVSDSLRVRVLEYLSDDDVVVVTADLRDAGTTLNLHPRQLVPEVSPVGIRHSAGFVTFGKGGA